MKKTLAIILALTMVLCLALTSCNKTGDNSGENNNSEVENNQDAKFDSIEAYNSYLENVLVEHQPKETLDEEVLATVIGLPISAANVKYTYMVVDAPYAETSTEEETKNEIERFYKENAALVKYAFENKIELSEQDITTIKANIASMQLQLGEEYESAFAESPFTKFFYYFQTSVMQSLYSRLYEQMLSDHESEMSKAVLEETLKYCEENDYIRAKHILVKFPEGEGEDGAVTDAQKQATLEKANEVLEKVNAMTDVSEFDALVEEYNEDPGMESSPGGYYFTKGEMVAPFEEAAYALEEGKTSGLVESPFGYHIIQKLPLNDEAIFDSQIYSQNFSTALYEDIIADVDSYEIEYAENHDARVDDFAREYEELQAKAETEAENETEAETEPTAEAE